MTLYLTGQATWRTVGHPVQQCVLRLSFFLFRAINFEWKFGVDFFIFAPETFEKFDRPQLMDLTAVWQHRPTYIANFAGDFEDIFIDPYKKRKKTTGDVKFFRVDG